MFTLFIYKKEGVCIKVAIFREIEINEDFKVTENKLNLGGWGGGSINRQRPNGPLECSNWLY